MSEAGELHWDFVNLRESPQAGLMEGIERMWREQAGLSPQQIEQRAAEVLLAAVDRGSGEPIGVSTVYLHRPGNLGVPLWTYRTFVTAAFRKKSVGMEMMIQAAEWLEDRYADGTDRRGQGVYMEIENPVINRHRNEAIWPRSRMAFVGLNRHGHVCRVRYFSGASLESGGPP